jgi:hypothetical protein
MPKQTTEHKILVAALRDLYHETYEATSGRPRSPGLVSALQQARVLLRRLPGGIAPEVIELAPYVREPSPDTDGGPK